MPKVSDAAQLRFLCRDILPLLTAVKAGYTYDLGDFDLDDEQPIWVRLSLGDYRRAVRLKFQVESVE